MKLKSSLHRTAVVLAGAVIGLSGFAAVAGPASAHNATVSGTSTCTNGKNVVTWTITNDWGTDATVSDLSLPPGQTPTNLDASSKQATLVNGTVIPAETHGHKTVVQYNQVVDQAATASLSFVANWPDYQDKDNSAQVNLDQNCGKDTTPKCVDADHARLSHTFAVDKVGGTTVISLKRGETLCPDAKIWISSASYYAPKPQFDVPQYLYSSAHGYISSDSPVLKLWVKTPPCYTQVDSFFDTQDSANLLDSITANGPRYNDLKLGSKGAPGNRSHGPLAAYNGGDQTCSTPASTSVPSCNGEQTINLSNSGKFDETFTVKYGDQVKTVPVAAGAGDSVVVPAGAGTVTVSAEGMQDQTYNWTSPQDCAPPTVTIVNTCKDVTVTVTNPKDVLPAKATVAYGKDSKELTVAAGSSESATFAAGSAKYATVDFAGLNMKQIKATLKSLVCTTPVSNNGGGGSLPITGAAGGSIAAGAAVLLIAGGVFFFVARRRRIRFTA